MKSKRYKVKTRKASEFGNKHKVFVIAKRTWFGFYWDTESYFSDFDKAQKCVDELNLIK